MSNTISDIIPPCVYYVPNFISESEEKLLLHNIYSSPKPKWTQLLNRRLQNWGGIPHHKGMVAEAIPQWLSLYIDRIDKLKLMETNVPNHVLINEYLPGQGIMAHVDGSLFYPTITTITCGSHAVIHFKKGGESTLDKIDPVFSLLLERRSLLVVQEDMYTDYLHNIDETKFDEVNSNLSNLKHCSEIYSSGEKLERETRLSLTIRHVPKTTRIKLKI